MQWSAAKVSRILTSAYSKCGFAHKTLIKWRPFICPFHRIVDFVPEGTSVLEVGCGVGLMTVLLAKLGRIRRALGIDVSAKAIGIARNADGPEGVPIAFECLPDNAEWPNGFETVLCIDVLHHIPRNLQRSFVRRLCAIRPGSTLILKDISPRPAWKAMANLLHDLVLSRELVSIRDECDVRGWLQSEGLEIATYRRLDVWWYSHYLVVAKRPLSQFCDETSH